MVESKFEIDDLNLFRRICGSNDANLRMIEKLAGLEMIPRGNTLTIHAARESGERALRLMHVLGDFLLAREASYELNDFDLRYIVTSVMAGNDFRPDDMNRLRISFPDSGRVIVPRTINQASYVNAMHRFPVTFATGPAGTGKTYLAVVVGLKTLLTGKADRIILTRPAVEAGENLGYLPGDLIQKINPYLRPLYDALFDLQPFEKISKLMEKNQIEIAPLAYMRGRTLNNSFIILDEAQNTTVAQMKMFLTRMGANSRIVISGDDTQIDLDRPKRSGLLHALRLLRDIKEISFIRFTRDDISRHPIVEKIVAAYEKGGYSE